MKRKITAVLENHFDQIWRRCFRKDICWHGENFISYEKLHKYYIEAHLDLAKKIPGYKFQIETPNVLENYLESHPQRWEELRRGYAEGVIKTTNTGYVICDSNLIGPESIIRNYLLSDRFFEEYMGKTPEIANRADAFGNSAQLPQILRQFGTRYVTSIYYADFDEDVWVGLDGSKLCITKHGKLGVGGGWVKYAPCPRCRGFGETEGQTCDLCGGMGIDLERGKKRWRAPRLHPECHDSGILRIGGEELLPSPDTPAQVAALAEQTGCEITLGHTDALLEQYRENIEKVEAGDLTGLKVRTCPEFNPNTTGGYVSRIRIKQRLSSSENYLLSAETLQAMQAAQGKLTEDYRRAWESYLLCGFHDSAAGTVVDAAYEEIMELFDQVDEAAGQGGALLFNGTSVPWSGLYEQEDGKIALLRNVPPYSAVQPVWEKPPVPVQRQEREEEALQETILTGAVQETVREAGSCFTMENEYLTVEADEMGLCRIIHKKLGVLADTVDDRRPCQWILQSDTGSPWCTFEPPYMTKPLTNDTHFVGLEKGEGFQRLCYEIGTHVRTGDTVADNAARFWVTLVDGMDKVFFHARVDWDTAGKRLMVCFPLAVKNGRDVYGIPGGWLYREPYEPQYDWNGSNGDWCAHRFGGVESAEKSVAVLNQGTPCYRILPEGEGRTLYMTVLRSPTIPTCLHEPISYTMKEYDGMRDSGIHSFQFALTAYDGPFAQSEVFSHGEQYARPPVWVNARPSVALPTVQSGTALVTHVKPAEDGNGIIVRVTEHGGQNAPAVLSVPGWVKKIYRTDMPERTAEPMDFSDTLTLPLHGFELATLRFV